MDARSRAGFRDDIIIGEARPDRPVCRRGMDREVHPRLDFHGFVIPDERPLDEVVSLTVGIGASFRGIPLFSEERRC